MQYKICSNCGCNLDHGERCDCRDQPTEDIIPRKGVMTNVNHNDKSRPDVPPGGTTGGGICESRHSLHGSAVFP